MLCGRPYVWGVTDCVSTWRAVQSAMRGVEDALPQLGRWRSALEAARQLNVRDPRSALEDLGATAHPAVFAQTGDLLYTPARGDAPASFVTVVGRHVLLAEPSRALTMTLASLAQRHALGATAWRIA